MLSTSASLPSELLPPRFGALAASAIYTPMGLGFVLGPLLVAVLQRAADDYGVAMGAASASLCVSSAIMAYLATLAPPSPIASA